MTEIVFLSSHDYETPATTNYGDCILINTGSELIIYDCGSEEHADSAISYMDQHGYKSAKLILSHNDNDHFKGIPKLLNKIVYPLSIRSFSLNIRKNFLKESEMGAKQPVQLPNKYSILMII